jgi:hypothetical protein
VNLPDHAERLEMAGKVRAAHRDPDAPAALGECTHQMAPDKTRAAVDRHQPVERNLRHVCLGVAGNSLEPERYSIGFSPSKRQAPLGFFH